MKCVACPCDSVRDSASDEAQGIRDFFDIGNIEEFEFVIKTFVRRQFVFFAEFFVLFFEVHELA